MPVQDTHKEYNENLTSWRLVRDCVCGSKAIKSRKATGEQYGSSGTSLWGMSGTAYLPPPNALDTSSENTDRYRQYVIRANYVNFTGFTKEGLLGMIFRKPMVMELPESISYLEIDATGGGLSLEQLTKDIAGDTLESGRYGLLVDYPEAQPGLTQAEVAASGLRASIKPYCAENIINWRTTVINGVKMLDMVVLEEEVEVIQADGFSVECETQYRVLLMKDGVYVNQLYDEDGEIKAVGIDDEENIYTDIVPRMADGKTWNQIPFVFVGSQNNDETVDKSPLYDIAEVNIAHYRNSADFEESSFMVGQPTPVIGGLSQSWVNDNFKDGVFLGSTRAVPLPEGGTAMLLQANENQMPKGGMTDKEQQMINIGARIISQNSGERTAEEARMIFGGQNSKLHTIVGNIESALYQCLEFISLFMGNTQEVKVELNTEFYDSKLDPQMVMAMIQSQDRGITAKQDTRRVMRKAGLIAHERTDEEIDAEAESFAL